jgi:hypothetical protein
LRVNRRTTIRTAVALCALLAGIVIAPSAAFGQSAAADQYVPNAPAGPSPDGDGGNQNPNGGGGGGGQNPAGGGGNENPSGAEAPDNGAGALSPSAGTGESSAGELPFTGYPLTALLLVVLILLAAGLLLRFGPSGFERLRGANGTTR